MFTIDGIQIEAPGFTPEQFDRAVQRAHDEGIEVMPWAAETGTVLTTSGDGKRVYFTTRATCTCAAGQRGVGCKHRSLAVFLFDVCGLDITQPGMPPRTDAAWIGRQRTADAA